MRKPDITVIVAVRKGIVYLKRPNQFVKVILHDYDIDNMSDLNIRIDPNGDLYIPATLTKGGPVYAR